MREFELLTAKEIECRISTVSARGLTLLLYKTARTDYAMLDKKFGMFGWQNEYEIIDGKMYCCISVKNPQTGEWVSKWNCGTESFTEAEKGQASDAMKRAGFCWGIGTELYSAPFIWIPAELCEISKNEKGKYVCSDKFYVTQIAYDGNEDISELQIKNNRGSVVFTHPRTKQQKTAEKPPVSVPAPASNTTPPKPQNTQTTPFCIECGAEVTEKVKDYSVNRYGYCLCFDCQKKYGSR